MADTAIQELIKQLKEEAVAERQKTLELFSKQAANGGRIGIANLDENLIRLIMTATTKQKSDTPKTEKGTPPKREKQDTDNLELNEIEIKAIDDLLNKNNVYLYGKAGTGKAQPLYSKILTPDGWKTMGDIKVGDTVITENATETKVLGVYDRGEKNIFRVYFNDGSFTDCCDEHLWKITNSYERANKKDGNVVALKDIKLKRPNGRNDAYIPVVKPINFAEKKHIVDAYAMGVILGDGGLTSESIKISKNDEELFAMVEEVLPDNLELRKQGENDGRVDTYILTSKTASNQFAKNNQYKEALINIGLMYKDSLNKFIPEQYKFDSLENRIKLFQGLNDTDGYVSKGLLEFSTSSERLKNDYVELVQSFGGTCTVGEKIPSYTYKGEKKDGQLAYRIYVSLPNGITPFRLTRKSSEYKERTKYFPYRYMESVEPLGKMPCRCIEVASESHLYITDNYIVTHNTVSAKKIAKRLHKDGFIKNPAMFYVLNCSQWTSPIQILGGWSIGGYKQGLATLAWMNGGVLILDELPKLDANTAGLLNEILSSTTEADATIVNGENDQKIPKHPDFYVIGTGNTDLKTTSMNFGGNNQQDYSLVDRFAGSMYYVDFDFVKELSLTTYPVFAIALGIRNFLLKDVNAVESVSLRTMLNFNRIYELEMLREYFPSSPLLINKNNYDTVTIEDFDEDGKPIKREVNQGKTLKDSVYSFINTLPTTKKNNILAEKLDTVAGYSGLTIDEALASAKDGVESFESEYIRLHGVSPVNEEPTSLSESQKRDFERIKESLPQKP